MDKLNLDLKSFIAANKKILCYLIALVAFISLLIFIFVPRYKEIVVTDVGWKYNIAIEKYKQVEHSDWYLPPDAELLYTSREIRSYVEVLDHYETVTKTRQVQDGYDVTYTYSDNGDGTFTEHEHRTPRYRTETYTEQEPVYTDEPVYDTKYYYKVWEWVHERDVTTTASDKNPYYGEVILGDKERQGRSTENYWFRGHIKDKKKEKKYKVKDRETWDKINVDYTLKVKMSGGMIIEYLEFQ